MEIFAVMPSKRWVVAASCALLPAVSVAGGLGIGTLEGTYDTGGSPAPVKGYIAIVELARDLVPAATEPDGTQCSRVAPLHRESTVAWQMKHRMLLAINAGFFWMPAHDVPDCQLPPYPYKANSFQRSLPKLSGHAPAILGLTTNGASEISYADNFDADRFNVIVSGDWVRDKDGSVVHRELLVDGDRENPTLDLAPRMAVGVQKETGRLIVVMIEGRQTDSKGLSLKGLASLMRACGVSDAINLDGGGSATFSYAPDLQPAAVTALKPIALSSVCNADGLMRGGLALTITQHPLEKSLRSSAPGGREASDANMDKGYRRVLTNLGFRFNGPARRELSEPAQ
ncbi:phosphodiester glycosidase family protein [Paraburkholderia fungorum]|uniref:phosphodiester glycosidase family protein n=1 Tax=Paraburkholderia fungorum TaxID=134537 RepID=UPI0038B901E7